MKSLLERCQSMVIVLREKAVANGDVTVDAKILLGYVVTTHHGRYSLIDLL